MYEEETVQTPAPVVIPEPEVKIVPRWVYNPGESPKNLVPGKRKSKKRNKKRKR